MLKNVYLPPNYRVQPAAPSDHRAQTETLNDRVTVFSPTQMWHTAGGPIQTENLAGDLAQKWSTANSLPESEAQAVPPSPTSATACGPT